MDNDASLVAESGAWLKLYRKAIDSQVFSVPELWHLFSYCLLTANGGQFVLNKPAAAVALHCSLSTLNNRLKKLQKLGCIEISSNNKVTVVEICNWKMFDATPEAK